MQAATRRYGSVAAVIALLAGLLSWTAWEANGYRQASAIVEKIQAAPIKDVPHYVRSLKQYHRWAQSPVAKLRSNPEDSRRELRHALVLALLSKDASQASVLRKWLLDSQADPGFDNFTVILNAFDELQPNDTELVPELWKAFRHKERDSKEPDKQMIREASFRAGLALAKYRTGLDGWSSEDHEFLAKQLVNASPDQQPILCSYLGYREVDPVRRELLDPLERVFRNSEALDTVREAAASVLGVLAADLPEKLAELISQATPGQYRILYRALTKNDPLPQQAKDRLVELVREQPAEDLDEKERVKLGQSRAGAAITLMRRGGPKDALEVFRIEDDPESLTQFVHRVRDRDLDPRVLVDALEKASDERERFALLLALGEFKQGDLPPTSQERLIDMLIRWYNHAPSSAIHGACGWLLRRWGHQKDATEVDCTPVAFDRTRTRQWFTMKIQLPPAAVAPEGELDCIYMTFVMFNTDKLSKGPAEPDQWDDEFAMLDREVTVKEWRAFERAVGRKALELKGDESRPDAPITKIDWYMAAEFCHWLTQQVSISEAEQWYKDPSHRSAEEPTELSGGRPVPKNWPFSPTGAGFRLPTDVEWERACHSGVRTKFAFGSDRTLLDKYAWFASNADARIHPGRELRPNLRGLFDMHGNAYEWCHDWYDDKFPPQDSTGPAKGTDRVLRGGAWGSGWASCQVAQRQKDKPTGTDRRAGLRLVWRPHVVTPQDGNP